VRHRPRSISVCAASVGGALAIAAAVAGFAAGRSNGTLAGPNGLSIVLVLGAGVAAVVRPRHSEILTAATLLVGMALVTELYGRFGLLFTPALLLMGVGIMRSQDAEARRRARRVRQRAVLATDGERRARLEEQERAIRRPRPSVTAPRAG
jgi:hypothetical protein